MLSRFNTLNRFIDKGVMPTTNVNLNFIQANSRTFRTMGGILKKTPDVIRPST
jgi:hypothetical protein